MSDLVRQIGCPTGGVLRSTFDIPLVVVIDFANTEEIPVFLRNWNVNRKRKFKPNVNQKNSNKRQRRTGPETSENKI
ncbi:hypothetical protein A0J61_10950 [Choanephora cucurbitarum]|uniref:Uncharacterized protein n=1 Tax=Choanephora cucurbitarum TaxID=101091 RepID=A0A1C7MX42_9FUNG|nr:hypothetical protein A0J61_10950 [Choanephora cucurbitarum]